MPEHITAVLEKLATLPTATFVLPALPVGFTLRLSHTQSSTNISTESNNCPQDGLSVSQMSFGVAVPKLPTGPNWHPSNAATPSPAFFSLLSHGFIQI